MSGTWSGAIIYEWIEEANDYGLISYGPSVAATATNAPPDGYTRSGTPTPVSPDFSNLSNQWKTLSPSGVKASAYSPSLSPPACPASTSGLWNVNGNVALPTLGQTFNAAVSSSILAGTATGTAARSSGTASGTAAGTAAASSASATGMASPSKEIAGMGAGLVGVMLGFLWWL